MCLNRRMTEGLGLVNKNISPKNVENPFLPLQFKEKSLFVTRETALPEEVKHGGARKSSVRPTIVCQEKMALATVQN